MKVAEKVLDVTSTIQGEKIDLSIDPNSIRHILTVLTDLYSDQVLAVIREYSTNAYDAHVEAGQKRPIEVTTPSSLSPYFSVRDFGEGLNAEDIRNVYSRYGASTKRESNDVVGQLGLGCKSALTYADQFTVTGIKNGVAIQVSISKDANGSGSMTILDQRMTDEPSGVEIIVPAKPGNDFQIKSENFFRFWEPGTVLLNNKAPKRIDGIWLANDLLLNQGSLDRSYIVMGNVPYPFPDHSTPSYGYSYGNRINAVAFVNIGDIQFTPSRESIMEDKSSKEKIAQLISRIRKEKNPAFEKMIEAAKSKSEAMEIYFQVKDLGYDGKATYKGSLIPMSWRPEPLPALPVLKPDGTPSLDYAGKPRLTSTRDNFIAVSPVKSFRGKGWSSQGEMGILPGKRSDRNRYIWIIGYDSDSFTPYKRAKLTQFMEKKGITSANPPERFLLSKKLPIGHDWLDPADVFQWADVEKEKIVREKVERRDGRPSGSYSGFVASGSSTKGILAATIDTTKPLFWAQGGDSHWGASKPEGFDVIREKHPDATVIVLHGNRIAKFQRDFPMAKKVRDYVTDLAVKWAASLTDEQKLALHLDQWENRHVYAQLLALNATEVDDPELKKSIDVVKNLHNNHKTLKVEWATYEPFGVTYKPVKWDNPMKKYSLLTSLGNVGNLGGDSKKHVYLYLNAAFAAMNKEV